MAFRFEFDFEFDEAAARDLRKLTRRDQPHLLGIVTEHLPAILRDPHGAGEEKKGARAHVRAYNPKVNNVVYRLVYTIEGDVVFFIAIGVHDDAYARAARHHGPRVARRSPLATRHSPLATRHSPR